jgi:hypothetical protein
LEKLAGFGKFVTENYSVVYKSDDFIANRLIWKAAKHNLPTKLSFFYKDVSPDIRDYLTSFIDTENSGQPVLFFTKPTREWTLVCTREVICNDNKTVFRIKISDIQHCRPTSLDNLGMGETINIKEVKKSEWHEVTVVGNSGKSFVVHAGKGSDLFALLNILLMLKRLSS